MDAMARILSEQRAAAAAVIANPSDRYVALWLRSLRATPSGDVVKRRL